MTIEELLALASEVAKQETEFALQEAILKEKRATLLQAMLEAEQKNIKVPEGTFALREKQNETLDEVGLDLAIKRGYNSAYWKHTINIKTCKDDVRIAEHIVKNPVTYIAYTKSK